MGGSQGRHLVTVWNPSYQIDALDAHADLLRRHAQEAIRTGNWDSTYVWWGKVRSANRQGPWARAEDARTLASALEPEDAPETHLYLTDYRSLYVGELTAIAFEDMRKGDPTHVPPYYGDLDLHCDAWFCLSDLRRLVYDDSLAVIEELASLRNVHYHDRPVSLYGGMVDLPLLVTRPDGRTWFEESEREALADGQLWVEHDATSGGQGAMERELRENLFGDRAWRALDPRSRTFIASAEKVYRDHRSDPAFDFGPVLTNLGKALELETNLRLRQGLRRAPNAARMANVDGRTIDVTTRHLSLGQLAMSIGGERTLNQTLSARLDHGAWFASSLPAILDDFRQARNPAAHSSRVDREAARRWRDRLMGVGQKGVLVDLAFVTVR